MKIQAFHIPIRRADMEDMANLHPTSKNRKAESKPLAHARLPSAATLLARRFPPL
jgi:hypothetical protein